MGKKRPQQMTWSDPFVWKMAPPKQSLDEGAKQDWTRGPEYWLGPDVWAPIEAKLIELGSDCPAELMYDLHYALSTVMQKYYQGDVMRPAEVRKRQKKLHKTLDSLREQLIDMGMPLAPLRNMEDQLEQNMPVCLMTRMDDSNSELRYALKVIEQCLLSGLGRAPPVLVRLLIDIYFPQRLHDDSVLDRMLNRQKLWS
jgi:hypothetical protein